MGAHSSERDRRHAKKLERLRQRQAKRDRRRAAQATVVADALDLTAGSDEFASSRQKLSEILLEFVQPYVSEEERTLDEMMLAIGFASLVWNCAVADESFPGAWDDLMGEIRSGALGEPEGVASMAEAMRRRKLLLHEDDLREIRSYDVTPRGDLFHVTVLSTLPMPNESDVEHARAEARAVARAPWTRPLTPPR